MDVNNKGIIVTGAGSGLGAATARVLVARGAKVLLVDLNEQAVAGLASELGERCQYAIADVSDESQAKAAVEEFGDSFGPMHGLVNCAGEAPGEKILARDGVHRLSTFGKTMQVNVVGTFNMLRFAASAIARNDGPGERGAIVNTASIAAFDGQIGQAAYACSKGGIVAMTLPVARELAAERIRVMCVAPGVMSTPMVMAMPAPVQEALGKMVPYPSRLGEAEEFARLVLHIFENTYLNGEVIRLDGAIRMAPR